MAASAFKDHKLFGRAVLILEIEKGLLPSKQMGFHSV
jgi:hypothetical protein